MSAPDTPDDNETTGAEPTVNRIDETAGAQTDGIDETTGAEIDEIDEFAEFAALEVALAGALTHRVSTLAPAREPASQSWTRLDDARHNAKVHYLRHSIIPMLVAAAAVFVFVVIGMAMRPSGDVTTNDPGGDPSTTVGTTPVETPDPGEDPVIETGTTQPAAEPAAEPAADAIRSADLANAAYPTALCLIDAEPHPSGETQFHNGAAGVLRSKNPDMSAVGFGMELGKAPEGVTYGDLTDDGVEEAAVIVNCIRWGSDMSSAEVAIMGLRDGRPQAIATITASGIVHTVKKPVVTDDRSAPTLVDSEPIGYGMATSVQITNGQLTVGWNDSAMGSAAYKTTGRYRITGDKAVLIGDSGPVLRDGQNFLDLEMSKYAIRTVDLRSMTLNLSAVPVCQAFFGGAPMTDVKLVGGTASLPDQQGTISIEDIRFGYVTQRYQSEQAIILARCTHGDTSIAVATVAELDQGRPRLITWVPDPDIAATSPITKGASVTAAFAYDGDLVITLTNMVAPGQTVSYELVWGGTSYTRFFQV
jgi:hypothetical protein